MSKRINMNAGASANGGVGVGMMTAAGNPWTVSDGMADELVNRKLAKLTDPQPEAADLLTATPAEAAAFKSLVSAPGILASAPIVTSARIGDSISTRDQPTVASGLNGPRADGIGFCGAMVSAGRVKVVTCRATGGFTIAQIAATHLPPALLDGTLMIDCLGGTNDCNVATPDAADVIFARLRDLLWLPIMAAGKVLRAYTIPPLGTATSAQRAAQQGVNVLIRAAQATYPNMILVDMDTLFQSADGSNGGAVTNYYDPGDGTKTHPQDTGSMVVAMEGWRRLQQRGVSGLSGEGISLASPYSLGTNPRGVGSNATTVNRTTLNAGVTGTGPHGWNFGRTGTASAVVTPGAVARIDGRDGQLVQVAFTGGAADDLVSVGPAYQGAIRLTGASSEDLRQNLKLYAPGEVRRFSNGLCYKTLTLGTTAAAEPGSLPTAVGGLVTDATVTWMKVPEVVAGQWVRTVAEFTVTAHATERVFFQALLRQYTSAFGNLAAGVAFVTAGTQYTAGSSASGQGSVFGPSVTGNRGYYPGSIPLNQLLRVESPWVQIASDGGILDPELRIISGASATATIQIAHLDLQLYSGSGTPA